MKDSVKRYVWETLTGIIVKHIEPVFKPDVLITVIVRTPDDDECDVLITADNIDQLQALLERSRSRESTT